MKPKFPHLESQWARYQIGRPHLAHAPTKGTKAPLGSDSATVPSEKKGWRLWCFHLEADRDRFLTANPEAVRL